MHGTRSWLRACLGVVLCVSACGCDDAQDRRSPPRSGCLDCGGSNEGGGGFSGAPLSRTDGGSSSRPSETAGNAAGGGAGVDSVGGLGGLGDAGQDAGAGGSGGADRGEQLSVCLRISQKTTKATLVAQDFVSGVAADCRVAWLAPVGQSLAELLNQLVVFNYELWGCPDAEAVDTFGLVLGTPALSQGDVDVLIEQYLGAAQTRLDLSPLERMQMQAALERLSQRLDADPSSAPSRSACPADADGSAGSGAGGSR